MFCHYCFMTPRKTTRDDSRKSHMSSFMELTRDEEDRDFRSKQMFDLEEAPRIESVCGKTSF